MCIRDRCYDACLNLAVAYAIRTIAFPAISTGTYRYPPERAAHIALRAVKEFAVRNSSAPTSIQFVLYDDENFTAYQRAIDNLNAESD